MRMSRPNSTIPRRGLINMDGTLFPSARGTFTTTDIFWAIEQTLTNLEE